MAETMLGPTVFVIVHTILEQYGIVIVIAQEERIPLGGNCQTVDLSLFAGFRVIVVTFYFED